METQEITKIAKLAKLDVHQETLEKTAKSITEVLNLVDQLQSINTDSTAPMAHPLDAFQTLREDSVTERNQREKYQASAPAVEDGLFLVPKVID